MERLDEAAVGDRLEAHASWVASAGSTGRRLTGPLDLSDRDLSDADLRGADLSGCNLTGVGLERADLRPAAIGDAREWQPATLRGSRLEQARFADARLDSTDLRDCDLRRAIFSDDAPVEIEQLSGAALTGTVLPRSIDVPRAMHAADETARTTRSLLLSLVAACTYTLIAVASTADADLFSPTPAFRLPIIDLQIAARPFFGWSAVLIAILFVYLQLQLRRVWDRYALLPSVLPDGTLRSRAASPGLFLSAPQSSFGAGEPTRERRNLFQEILGMVFLWALPVLTLLFLWARYLPGGDAPITRLHTLCVAAAAASAMGLLVAWLRFSGASAAKEGGIARAARSAVVFLVLVAVFVGMRELSRMARTHEADAGTTAEAAESSDELRGVLAMFGVSPFATLAGASLTPDVSSDEFTRYEVSGRPLLVLEDVDLRRADLTDATAIRVNFSGANLTGAVLRDADLRGAIFNADTQLAGCDFSGADLRHAQLVGADLSQVTMSGDTRLTEADLTEANLQGLDLHEVDLNRAKLGEARLEKAILSGAQLEDADLNAARMEGADLTNAILDRAHLEFAYLSGAKGVGAQLVGAYLISARASRAIFAGATLTGADFKDATLKHADFQNATVTGANFAGADLAGSDLRCSRAEGAIFDAGSVLEGAAISNMSFLAEDVETIVSLGVRRGDLRIIGADEGAAEAYLEQFVEEPRGEEKCRGLPEEDRILCEFMALPDCPLP